MYRTLLTFTVSVPVVYWMKSTSEASKTILLSFLEDVASSLNLKGSATACVLDSRPELWFTFFYEEDKNEFMAVLDSLWKEGGWLSDGLQ